MSRVAAVLQCQAIESMRASDFDIPSAIGELIDNSLQANSKHINVQINSIKLTPKGSKERELIKEIICADDGSGMNGDVGGILHNCICLGYSSRYNNRDGIGRFGVGMTYAGIRFATKIEVYSKVKDGEWMYVKFDLKNHDDMSNGIDDPIIKAPPLEYQYMVKGDHGTFVIWSDFDKYNESDMYVSNYDDYKAFNTKRRVVNYTEMKPEESLGSFGLLNNWIGRTFRKFIWKGIEITLNGNKVYAFDPLFLNKESVQFKDDEPAKIIIEDDIDWYDDKIHYIFTLLPEMYREKSSQGGFGFPGRYIYNNEGISIMRADREVYYDQIPRLQKSNSEKITWDVKDRWWGCEISFNPKLDEYFSVKNIKRGAIPVKELNEVLYLKLKGLINEARKEVSEYWKQKETETLAQGKGNTHASAEDLAKKTKLPGKILSGVNKTDDEIEKEMDRLAEGLGYDEMQKKSAIFKDQPFTIQDASWRGDRFIDSIYLKGNAVLQYNINHPFMDELSKLRKKCRLILNQINLQH